MSTSATLAYSVTAFGPTVPATLEAALAAVVLNYAGIEDMTGAVLASDTTGLTGSVATRTIVFTISGATFQLRFPPGSDQSAPFNNLYTQTLAAGVKSFVTSASVVIA
jgi:hypothetical protein